MKMVIYFHGYNSSPKTDKVSRLKELLPNHEVLAFPINPDPEIAERELSDSIIFAMISQLHDPDKVTFIGTSHGAWWAAKMADSFAYTECVLINPCYDPENSLKKYGVSDDILKKYHKMNLDVLDNKTFVFAESDEVIDHSELISELDERESVFEVYQNTSHRFNGPEFEDVIEKFI